MSAILTSIAIELFKALVTKRFFARTGCMIFWRLSQMSKTDFDDNIVDNVAIEWGVAPEEYK